MPAFVVLKLLIPIGSFTVNLIPLGLWLLKTPLGSRWSSNSKDTDNFNNTAVSKHIGNNLVSYFLINIFLFNDSWLKERVPKKRPFVLKKKIFYIHRIIHPELLVGIGLTQYKIYEHRIAFCTNDGAEGTKDPILHIPTRCLLLLLLLQDMHHIVLVQISGGNLYCTLGHI